LQGCIKLLEEFGSRRNIGETVLSPYVGRLGVRLHINEFFLVGAA
jgi:hypothetical protein